MPGHLQAPGSMRRRAPTTPDPATTRRRQTPFGGALCSSSHPALARAPHTFPRPRRFQPSTVRKICEEVITSELTGKTWNGEEEPVWTVRISEQIKARARGESSSRPWGRRSSRALAAGGRQPRPSLFSHSRVLPFCVCSARLPSVQARRPGRPRTVQGPGRQDRVPLPLGHGDGQPRLLLLQECE